MLADRLVDVLDRLLRLGRVVLVELLHDNLRDEELELAIGECGVEDRPQEAPIGVDVAMERIAVEDDEHSGNFA